MQLIAMYQKNQYSSYIEGFHKKYECITLWNDSDGLQLLSASFFDYTSENRVSKFINPFQEVVVYLIAMHQLEGYPRFIEGFSAKYPCITLWKDTYGLVVEGNPFFTYTTATRIRRYINPFN